MLNCNIFLWIGWFLWQRKDFAQNLLLWSLNQSFKVRLIFFQTISFIMSQYIFCIYFIMSLYIPFEIISQWRKSRESISVPWKLFKAHLTNIRSQEEKRRRKKREKHLIQRKKERKKAVPNKRRRKTSDPKKKNTKLYLLIKRDLPIKQNRQTDNFSVAIFHQGH